MQWDDLNPEQKYDVKENYMVRLAEEGRFIKTIYGENSDEPAERGPTQGELCLADQLISDEEMKLECKGIEFVAEDFSSSTCSTCSSQSEQWRFTPGFVSKWAEYKLTVPQYEADHDRLHTNCDIRAGIEYAATQLKSFLERFEKGQLNDDERRILKELEENNSK